MRFTPLDPPRTFTVGKHREITLRDCGRVELEPDEQVTFVTASGTELDVTRKSWGYYATPSLNKRLPRFGLRAALTQGQGETLFLLLVEEGKESEFDQYLQAQGMQVVCWLDAAEAVKGLGGGA